MRSGGNGGAGGGCICVQSRGIKFKWFENLQSCDKQLHLREFETNNLNVSESDKGIVSYTNLQ